MAQESTKKSYRVTLLGPVGEFNALARVTNWLAVHSFTVTDVVWLSSLDNKLSKNGCVELTICVADNSSNDIAQNVAALKSHVLAIDPGLDIVVQSETARRVSKRLAVFDMDSTLIKAEVIDELAVEAGIGAQVAAITEQAMRGEIDFNESFRQRLALLKGLDESALERVFARLVMMDGAGKLMVSLRRLNCKTAIISGGFSWFANRLKIQLGMDYAYANTLEIVDGKVTGEVEGTIIDARQKAILLHALAEQEGLLPEQVIAVGDGANDLEMLAAAGLGIAFHAKPLVRQHASHVISTQALDVIPYLLGLYEHEFM